jgi:hypothetical protein
MQCQFKMNYGGESKAQGICWRCVHSRAADTLLRSVDTRSTAPCVAADLALPAADALLRSEDTGSTAPCLAEDLELPAADTLLRSVDNRIDRAVHRCRSGPPCRASLQIHRCRQQTRCCGRWARSTAPCLAEDLELPAADTLTYGRWTTGSTAPGAQPSAGSTQLCLPLPQENSEGT